jgi:hypothetical protein
MEQLINKIPPKYIPIVIWSISILLILLLSCSAPPVIVKVDHSKCIKALQTMTHTQSVKNIKWYICPICHKLIN